MGRRLKEEAAAVTETDQKLEELLVFLKDNRGFDFTGYKRASLTRRVGYRMQQLGVASLTDYLDYVEVHPHEVTQLFNTILINMTGFFRDLDSWLYLRSTIIPELVSRRDASTPLRIWCAGCATGEEAYSLAILLADELGAEELHEHVKIFATDVDEEALAIARRAVYGERAIAGVPAELRDRYFENTSSGYAVRADLRRAVIFGRNDLVRDAPIGRADILVCRNTLIYFNTETQRRVLSRFGFSLIDGGVLFLGRAEMLLSHDDLFSAIDFKHRFFRKIAHVPPGTTVFPSTPGDGELRRTRGDGDQLRHEAWLASPVAAVVISTDGILTAANQRAALLFGITSRDLGRPFRDLEMSYRPVELRAPVEEALRARRPVWLRDVEWLRAPAEPMYLDIQVMPLAAGDRADVGCALYLADVTATRRLRGDLQIAHQQISAVHNELQSMVQELEATNEELQSAVEELETTNEELQSTNDDLQAVNETLHLRTRQVDEANVFLESILTALRTAVIVVDPVMVVLAWNDHAERLLGVPADEAVGQHLLNLNINLGVDGIRTLLREALSSSRRPGRAILDGHDGGGQSISVRVECAPLSGDGEAPNLGAILVLDAEPQREARSPIPS